MKPAHHALSISPTGEEIRRVAVYVSDHEVMTLMAYNKTGKKIQQVRFTKREGEIKATKIRGKKLDIDPELERLAREHLQ